jgi:solute carrier family 25 uncoupling protein 8/9
MESGSVLKGLVYGGFASCVAETVTMPVDVVKTRLQMDGQGGVKMYNGAMDCASKLVKSEGPSSLFKGLPPALVRQSTYGSLRYGLYGPIKNSMGIKAGEKVPLWKKIVAGGGAGAIASAVANPTDLLKVRLQTDGMAKDAEGKYLPKRYTGMVHAFTTTVKEEGVLALWTGVGPTVGRATALAAAELATYDEVKGQLLASGYFQPGLVLTITTAFASGYVSTVASSPFDVVKSRVMGQPLNPDGTGKFYAGMVDCFVKSSKSEGIMSLYNGFWPNFGRVVPRVTIVFIVMEQLKKNFG